MLNEDSLIISKQLFDFNDKNNDNYLKNKSLIQRNIKKKLVKQKVLIKNLLK